MQKNIASQKWYVFAFDETNNTPVTGDSANITADVHIDGAGANAVDNTNPTELSAGYYVFDITDVESNGDQIVIIPVSATGNVQVVGVPGSYDTTAPNANLAAIDGSGRVDVGEWLGTTVATPTIGGVPEVDLTYIMGVILAEGGAGRLAAAFNKLFDVATPVLVASDVMVGTDGANTTTPPTVTEIQAEMEENGASILDSIFDVLPGSTMAAATDIPAMVGTNNAALASVATEARLAELDVSNLPADIAAIPTTAMRGTDSAALASVATEARLAELDAGNLPADVAAIPTTAMRGTDNAALASVATEARLAELDAANLLADVAAIPTTAMRGTDNAALSSVATEARLAELDAANIPADVDDIKTVIDFVNKWLVNKIVFTGTSMILYDDDGTTPLKTWTLSEGSLTVDGPYNRSAAA